MTELSDLRNYAFARAGGHCELPGCEGPFDQLAHLQHRGMGGGPAANTEGNVLGMCLDHHLAYDGNGFDLDTFRLLLGKVTYRDTQYCDWVDCPHHHVDYEIQVRLNLEADPWIRKLCANHVTLVEGKPHRNRRHETRLLLAELVRRLRVGEER